jgi:hypothetical protein
MMKRNLHDLSFAAATAPSREEADGSRRRKPISSLRLGILIKRSQANPFIQTERHGTRRDTSSEARKKEEEIPGGGAAKGKRPTRDPQKKENERRKKPRKKQTEKEEEVSLCSSTLGHIQRRDLSTTITRATRA